MKRTSLTWNVTQLFLTTGMLVLLAPTLAIAMEISSVEGTVQVQRNGKSLKAYTGQPLVFGDVLKAGQNSRASVHCFESYGDEVSAGEELPVSQICPAKASDYRDINTIKSGGSNPLIPYIISPRYTLAFNSKPTFHWNAVEGATLYTVSLYKVGLHEDELVWETQSSGTAVAYLGEKSLQPGVDYKLVVKANNGRSSEEEKVSSAEYNKEERGVSGLQFRLIPQQKAQSVRTGLEKIVQQQLTGDREAIALAYLYAGNNLYAEAIETLEAVVKSGTQSPDVYRSLGDFYARSGLNLLAEERYKKAIELATAKQDVQEQALSQQGLGEVYVVMNKTNNAVSLLKQALSVYQNLGNTELADQVAKLINRLSNS